MITSIKIMNDNIYLDGNLSMVRVSDFSLDFNIYSCKLGDLRRKSKPILKKLFQDNAVYTGIRINTNTCLYHIRKMILSLVSISEKIKISVSNSTGKPTFVKLSHGDIILFRYFHLLESLLNREFGKDKDLLYYALHDSCYKNILCSDHPVSNNYKIFVEQMSGIFDNNILTEDYYDDRILSYMGSGLFNVKNDTIFPGQSTIDEYGWTCGYFDEYFHYVKNIISDEMQEKIKYNYLFFDPIIDKNFQTIINGVSGRKYGKK